MSTTKKLLLKVSSGHDVENEVVPVNTGKFVDIKSDIGLASVSVYIRNFDGSQLHQDNSLYNAGDSKYLNGDASNISSKESSGCLPNLRIILKLQPSQTISGLDLLFGNDCTTPIRDYVPTTLLATGLKFFSWFINPTIQADIYCESPYIYAPALNSFSTIGISDSSEDLESLIENDEENLALKSNESVKLPKKRNERIKHFCKLSNCKQFQFQEGIEYLFVFDTNYLQLGDSNYNVAIPTFGNRTFDINVLRYANNDLNNFNWTLKSGGIDGIDKGTSGLVLNFSLVNENTN
ncbi:CIC11C00000003273 [Sungouiella intermedia]|uniref:CIC11C00000003273 n=1 Tax=Sungouiella intermedia TaxID=45354 RepID=A0A1L0BFX6_9ASCO|nr:CIC11C00000003273 [[Candida] intermedia]